MAEGINPATGKAILGILNDGYIGCRFEIGRPQRLAVHRVAYCDLLLPELTLVRQRGHSVDNGQIREGMFCIGAPEHDFSGQAAAGLAVSILEQEATDAAVDEIGGRRLDIASSLSSRLGNI